MGSEGKLFSHTYPNKQRTRIPIQVYWPHNITFPQHLITRPQP